MRVTLMHNPTAGDEQFSGDELLEMVRDAGYKAVYQSTKDDDYASALKDPGDLVVAAGGDGTVRKTATRLIGREIPLAILPLGTANNISKSLGITGSPRQLIAGWARAPRKKFDVGVASGPWGKKEKRFIEAAGCGLLTRVMSDLDAKEEEDPTYFERTPDPLGLARSALRETLSDYRPHDLQVTLDGHDFSGQYLLLEAMNIRLIGPNLELVPEAEPADGYLDVVFLTADKREEFTAYLSHRLEGTQETPYLPVRRARHLQIAWEGMEIHLDDEIWPEKKREKKKAASSKGKSSTRSSVAMIDIRLESQALDFLVSG